MRPDRPVHTKSARPILMMLSGGLDSTTCLLKLLRDHRSGYGPPVLVHHVIKTSKSGRRDVELASVQAIVDDLRQEFEFEFTTSESTIQSLVFCNDIYITRFHGALVASKYGCGSIATGRVKDDDNSAYHRRERRAEMIARGLGYGGRVIYPIKDWHKGNCIEFLLHWRPSLIKHTWSCLRPVVDSGNHYNCGTCSTCHQIRTYSHDLYALNARTKANPNQRSSAPAS
jgi:7-cyano-7-deazaguanine synthase in queuosine biosynthesis